MATGKGGKGKPEGAIAKKETKAKTKAKAKAKPRTQDGSPIRDYLEGPGGSHAQSYRRGHDHRVRIPAQRTLACNKLRLHYIYTKSGITATIYETLWSFLASVPSNWRAEEQKRRERERESNFQISTPR